jgi:hypothetical protein
MSINKYKLTDDIFDGEIKNIVSSIFPNMNISEKDMLCDYVIRIVNIIAICFSFEIEKKRDVYLYQFRQNNYQDIKWIIQHLLPYINTENNVNNITSFNDIYLKKKKDVNINEEEPNYLYSNLQYNRCIRERDNYKEREFKKEDLEHNYYLLVNSIRNCSNKLCVNWINLMPYTMKAYNKSKLYKDTVEAYGNKKVSEWNPIEDTNLKISYDTLCENLSKKSAGLYVGHIYEEIVDLYYSIKDYKWIIYDLKNPDKTETSMVMTEFIQLYFRKSYKNMLQYSEWEDNDDEMMLQFKRDIEVIKPHIEKAEIKIMPFARGFVLAFDKSFHAKIALAEGYKSVKQLMKEKYNIDEDDIDYDDDNYNDNIENKKKAVTDDIITDCFLSLNDKFIYEFIAESLQKLKLTWYGYYLLSDDKTDILILSDTVTESSDESDQKLKFLDGKDLNFDEIKTQKEIRNNSRIIDFLFNNDNADLFFNPKFLYNFAKSFVHISEYEEIETNDGKTITKSKEWLPMSKNWASLDKKNKEEIINRINGIDDPLEWFNINGYIRRISLYNKYSNLNEDPVKSLKYMNLFIYKIIRHILVDVIFQSLIHKGILTQFIPDKERSETRFFDGGNLELVKETKKQKQIFKTDDNNEYWTSTYHYLTSLRYKDMDTEKFYIKDGDKNYNYFTFGLKIPWYVAGAYDWIGQIGFCHHFINNRVIYITGGTGVGKSTEIPKLFMYYSKVIYGNLAPKVVCTQPRQNAVEENADRVSSTLSVPVVQNKKATENFYIQFKHKNKKHTQTVHYPSLKFITGDSLMLELNDPFLKRMKKRKSQKDSEQDVEYSVQNKYDIIMIDEAHEHKKHMDLLMTFLKLPVYLNNSLKLVIVSATMDDDEPKYRRFFRDINDNLKFPLDTWIKDNKIDRINVDRRYHIAPPGAGTRFVIKENYRPLKDENSVDELYNNIKDIVNEILNKSSEGDILIFQPGVGEILQTIEILNKNTPSDVIAIPYHRELSDDHKKVIQKLADRRERNSIRLDKTKDFKESDFKDGNNQYKRFIIIATNIAEASITIGTLKYVIETGTEKAQIYDYNKRSERIFKDKISESSRRQRKGRVGRTSSGEVYYLYPKGMTENNKIPYEFSRMKIDDILFHYLREKEEDTHILSNLKFYDIKYVLDVKKNDIFKKEKSLQNILQTQYYIGDKYYKYYGNEDFYDYKNCVKPYTFYKTGTDALTLNDNNGEYYIIHPDELELIRNINGDIVGIKNTDNSGLKFKKIRKYKGMIISKKMDSFWQILIDYMYVGTNKKNNDLLKTSLGKFFNENTELFSIYDHGLLRTIIFGLAMEYKDILKLCAMCETIGYDISNLFIKFEGKKTQKNPKPIPISSIPLLYKKFSGNISSDCDVIMEIIGKYQNYLKTHMMYKLDDVLVNEFSYPMKLLSEEKIYLSRDQVKELLTRKRSELSKNLIDKINLENIDEKIKKCAEITQKNLINSLENSKEVLSIWCSDNYLDYDVLVKYTEKYIGLESSYLNLINNDNEAYKFLNELKIKFKNIDNSYTRNKLKTSLLFGFPQNIVSKIINTEKYISLYTPGYNNVYTISSLGFSKPKSFVRSEKASEYLLYLKNNIERDEMLIIIKIDINDILLFSHIYNINDFKLLANVYDTNDIDDFNKNKYINNKINQYKEAVKNNRPSFEKARLAITGHETNNIINNHKHSIKKIFKELSENINKIKSNLNFIKIIEPDMKHYIKSLDENIEINNLLENDNKHALIKN